MLAVTKAMEQTVALHFYNEGKENDWWNPSLTQLCWIRYTRNTAEPLGWRMRNSPANWIRTNKQRIRRWKQTSCSTLTASKFVSTCLPKILVSSISFPLNAAKPFCRVRTFKLVYRKLCCFVWASIRWDSLTNTTTNLCSGIKRGQKRSDELREQIHWKFRVFTATLEKHTD